MLCILFLFSCHPPFNDLQWKVCKPPNKRKGLIYCSLVIILRTHESSVNNLSFLGLYYLGNVQFLFYGRFHFNMENTTS